MTTGAAEAEADLAVILVSTNEAQWLRACLPTVFAHAGGATLDVIVVDNESTDGTRELVEGAFPNVRLITCRNRGFAHANNRGLKVTNAPYVLFLNPDTEVVSGTFADLLAHLAEQPNIGLVGVRQLTSDGVVYPTIRRFPTLIRMLGEAFASERLPWRASWLGERELDPDAYERETQCDWTSGSFMLARREAIESAGFLDERFFIYSEETDFCLRIVRSGWEIYHFPYLTIIHHAGKGGFNPRMASQEAYARRQYLSKHYGPIGMAVGIGALTLRYAFRAIGGGRDKEVNQARRAASRNAVATLFGLKEPPFGPPPRQAVSIVGDEPS
jgi:GT2 family glycosyltransferase